MGEKGRKGCWVGRAKTNHWDCHREHITNTLWVYEKETHWCKNKEERLFSTLTDTFHVHIPIERDTWSGRSAGYDG